MHGWTLLAHLVGASRHGSVVVEDFGIHATQYFTCRPNFIGVGTQARDESRR